MKKRLARKAAEVYRLAPRNILKMLVILMLVVHMSMTAHAVKSFTKEMLMFDDESEVLYKNRKARLTLGRHGELVVEKTPEVYLGERNSVNVLGRADGDYDLAVFVYPNRYYYGRITASGDILYNFDKLPPFADKNTFAGPLEWPFLDGKGHPDFSLSQKTTVLANIHTYPMPEIKKEDLLGTVYVLADDSFYVFSETDAKSPFVMLLVKDVNGKDMNVVAPSDLKTPFLTIVNGGWTNSWVVYKRKADGTPLTEEVKREWPFFDKQGNPSILSQTGNPLRLRQSAEVSSVWQRYDKNGKPSIPMTAPIP